MDGLRLTDYLDRYDSAVDKKELSLSWIRTLIKELRKGKISRPDIVLQWGPKLLSGESHIEVWNLHEQICIAAIDTGNLILAAEKIDLLKKQFSDSNRVRRLEGMLLEATGHYEEAFSVYDEILQKDLANIAAMKRKACIRKAQGNIAEYVETMNAILNIFPSDAASWMEMGELYMGQCDYQAAAHCFEELILLDPRNAHYHARLAESYYSQGGVENIRTARKHYTVSLNFQAPKLNLRSVYGLLSCCKAVQATYAEKGSGARKTADTDQDAKVNAELLRYAKVQLEELSSEKESVAFVHSALV